MAKNTFPIDSDNQQVIRDYILRQFKTQSWWPTEGPLQAREEFDALDDSADALHAWCDKWLNGGQWRQLKVAVATSGGSTALS